MSERRTLVLRRTGPGGRELAAVEVVAHEAGLHPDLVRRLIALGALEPRGTTSSSRRVPRDAGARLAKVVRLRRDLGLNYAGALLACDLLERIDALEESVARAERATRKRR